MRGYKFEETRVISGTPRQVFRLDVINPVFNSGYSFASINSIVGTGTYPFNALVAPAASGRRFVSDNTESSLVFELPYGFNKATTPNLYTRFYQVTDSTESTSGQPTLITIGAPGNEVFDDEVSSFTVFVDHSGGVSGTPQSVVLTNAGQTATLDVTNIVGTGVNGSVANVIAKTFNRSPVIRSKTLTLRTQTLTAAAVMTLDRADIAEIISIYQGDNDVIDSFTLDNG